MTKIEIDDELGMRLRALATRTRRPADALLHEALEQYFERGERRAAFLREAEEAARDFDRTGAHVPHDEVEAWIDHGGDDRPLALPKCRS